MGRLTGLGIGAGAIAALAARDLIQKKHSVLRNYPVVGHMRYLLEEMDEDGILDVDRQGDVANCGVTEYSFDPTRRPDGGLRLALHQDADPGEPRILVWTGQARHALSLLEARLAGAGPEAWVAVPPRVAVSVTALPRKTSSPAAVDRAGVTGSTVKHSLTAESSSPGMPFAESPLKTARQQ